MTCLLLMLLDCVIVYIKPIGWEQTIVFVPNLPATLLMWQLLLNNKIGLFWSRTERC